MKKLILTFLFISTVIFNLIAQKDSVSNPSHEEAKRIAVEWTRLLTEGKSIDSIMSISKVPFDCDRKSILNSNDELKGFYNKVIEGKGQRNFPKVSTEVYNPKDEEIEGLNIPFNVLGIKITLLEGDLRDEVILVKVDMSEEGFKVVGFLD